MANFDTYSFSDTHFVFIPTGYASYTMDGQGVGEITITYSDDLTAHDRGADGRIAISKIKSSNGTISITVFQTSPIHKYFKTLLNRLRIADAAFWAANTITISSTRGSSDNIVATGVSFTKFADQPYQEQSQRVTWNFMAADIQQL